MIHSYLDLCPDVLKIMQYRRATPKFACATKWRCFSNVRKCLSSTGCRNAFPPTHTHTHSCLLCTSLTSFPLKSGKCCCWISCLRTLILLGWWWWIFEYTVKGHLQLDHKEHLYNIHYRTVFHKCLGTHFKMWDEAIYEMSLWHGELQWEMPQSSQWGRAVDTTDDFTLESWHW